MKKIEHIIPTFKQLSSLQAISELMTSLNHYINLQLTKFSKLSAPTIAFLAF